MHTPDASHASSLRAKLASLQLTGNNLSFGFQLPGQTFKLQLLERERERGGGCIKTVRLFIYCFIYSRPEHYFGSVVSDTFFIVVKWTLQSVVGKQARYHRVCQLHTARHSWEESDMLRKNCDTKLKPSQMWHLLFCHQEKHSEQMKGHEGSGDLIYFHFFLRQECFYSNACLRNVWMCTLLL